MDISYLESRIDERMRKDAGYVTGDPKNMKQLAAQTALYFAPITGTAMSFKDAYNSFKGGRILGGIGNTAVGVASGLADLFTLGAGGSAMRAALKSGKLATMFGKARQAGRVARAMQAHRLGKTMNGTVNILRAGKTLTPGANYLGNKLEERASANAAKKMEALVPPKKPRYGYNPETFRYERLYN